MQQLNQLIGIKLLTSDFLEICFVVPISRGEYAHFAPSLRTPVVNDNDFFCFFISCNCPQLFYYILSLLYRFSGVPASQICTIGYLQIFQAGYFL